MITNEDKFLALFPTFYFPRILKYTKKVKPPLLNEISDIKDDNLKALLLLPVLLPSPNYTKRISVRIILCNSLFIDILKNNDF